MMKKTLFLLACFYYCTTVLWGQTIQQGIVYQYNGEKPRTPLANVTISCSSALNTNVLSEADGTFSLNFRDKRIGDPIGKVEIQKREMIVFNQAAVDEWSIRKEPLVLIMCDKAEFDKEKQRLIDIGKRETEKRYNQRREELEAEYEKGRIAIKEKEDRLNQMWDQMMRYHNSIDQYADIFVRIDLSETDSTSREAIRLFKMGRVDEAIQVFESQDNMSRLAQENQSYKKIQSLENKVKQTKETAEAKIQKTIEALHIQADAYIMVNDWVKAGAILKELAEVVNSKEELDEYGFFAELQGDYGEAADYYLRSIELFRRDLREGNQIDSLKFSIAINDLARVYSKDVRRFGESERFFREAIQIRQRLVAKDKSAYAMYLASSYTQLGTLYASQMRNDECRLLYKDAIELCRQHDSKVHLINALSQYASFLQDIGCLHESEEFHLEALSVAQELSDDSLLAMCLVNISGFYAKEKQYQTGIDYGLKAVTLLRRLSKDNPKRYLRDLAAALNNMAACYNAPFQNESKYLLYKEAVDIQRELARKNPFVFEPFLVVYLSNFATTSQSLGHEEESYSVEKEAIGIQRRLVSLNPQATEPMLAVLLYNAALQRSKDGLINEALANFEEALAIQRSLSNKHLDYDEDRLAVFLIGFAKFLYHHQGEERGDSLCQEAISHYTQLFEKSPELYAKDLAEAYLTFSISGRQITNEEKVELLKKALTVLSFQKDDSEEQLMISISGSLSYVLLLLKRFEESESYAKKAKEEFPENLAAALLFQGKYSEAESIYLQYKNEKREDMLDDLTLFEEAGIIDKDKIDAVEKIKSLLKEE